jgi:hypothetical protein
MSSLISDKYGKIYNDDLLPDIQIVEGDDFNDLTDDAKVSAALRWLKDE